VRQRSPELDSCVLLPLEPKKQEAQVDTRHGISRDKPNRPLIRANRAFQVTSLLERESQIHMGRAVVVAHAYRMTQ
jgi:hypothetical protein